MDSPSYITALAQSLGKEYADHDLGAPPEIVGAVRDAPDFASAVARYEDAAECLVGELGARFSPAQAYRSMEEFWADAEAQAIGLSRRAYWDSYENGARRIAEQALASAFGADHAVLVNSGMAALDLAIRCRLAPVDCLLIHERAYFETQELLSGVYGPWGVKVVSVDMRDAAAVRDAIRAHRPRLALIEMALNGPRCDVPCLEPLLAAETPTIIDMSALGHGLDPSRLALGPNVVYIESGMKYLTRSAGVGVIYGWSEWIEAARLYARRTGNQLQGRALHWLRYGEIALCRDRLRLHSERRRTFAATLRESMPTLTVSDALTAVGGRDDAAARLVRSGADGCMVFVRLPHVNGRDPEVLHRATVARWARAFVSGRVRAGFGWTETTARAYGRDALNTAMGECFIRISVGIEPHEEIVNIARQLARTATEVIAEVEQ
ncbi:MAG TPA: PLP-dependent transferase [Candidatus Limnocylindrales bacterium]|nr:PLP-dependent transferase [Candidatus Limnocylindrales bacterium]